MLDALKKILSVFGIAGNGSGGGGADPEMISCDEALDRLFEYLDGELEDDTKEKVAQHFEICRRCYPRLQFEKSFMEAVHRVQSGEDAPPELKNRILEALEQEGLDRN